MKVLVGSRNPVKLEVAEEVFSKYFAEVEKLAFYENYAYCDAFGSPSARRMMVELGRKAAL